MLSEEYLRTQFPNNKDEWIYIPFKNEYHEINTFDDGISKLIDYENKWAVFGKWRGKLALYNLIYPNIIIHTISRWKVNNAKTFDDELKWRVKLIEHIFPENNHPIPNSIEL